MKRNYIHILIFCFISPLSLLAQEYNLRDKFAFSMNCSLPKTTNNSAFKTTFNGIGDLDASVNYRLNENFELSASCRYAYFQLNSVIFKENITGTLYRHSWMVKTKNLSLHRPGYASRGPKRGSNWA